MVQPDIFFDILNCTWLFAFGILVAGALKACALIFHAYQSALVTLFKKKFPELSKSPGVKMSRYQINCTAIS